jgi:hypothetical protein
MATSPYLLQAQRSAKNLIVQNCDSAIIANYAYATGTFAIVYLLFSNDCLNALDYI